MTEPAAASADTSDAVLLEAAGRGELFAWERIVRQYQEPVYWVAYLVVRTTDLAEAATQNTFIRAYRALPTIEPGTALMPWLFRIVAGEARQQRREAGRPKPSSRPADESDGPQNPASAIPGLDGAAALTPAERDAVGSAFDRLGEEDRLVIASRYLFGLSAADAAAALAIASGLVDEHLATAIKNLRTRLADA